jgi:hypothetical protein
VKTPTGSNSPRFGAELPSIQAQVLPGTRLQKLSTLAPADFIVATREDALCYQGERLVSGNVIQCAEHKNFTPLALGMLWAILRQEEWDAKTHSLSLERISEDGGVWLFRFPNDLVMRLTTIEEQTTAAAWESPEVPGKADGLMPVLSDLKHLASHARASGLGLYLRGSL